jgi:hypothetical protein
MPVGTVSATLGHSFECFRIRKKLPLFVAKDEAARYSRCDPRLTTAAHESPNEQMQTLR